MSAAPVKADAAPLGEVKVEYVNTDANAADILTKALERDAFERHCATLSGAEHQVPVASMGFEDPLAAWEQFYAERRTSCSWITLTRP